MSCLFIALQCHCTQAPHLKVYSKYLALFHGPTQLSITFSIESRRGLQIPGCGTCGTVWMHAPPEKCLDCRDYQITSGSLGPFLARYDAFQRPANSFTCINIYPFCPLHRTAATSSACQIHYNSSYTFGLCMQYAKNQTVPFPTSLSLLCGTTTHYRYTPTPTHIHNKSSHLLLFSKMLSH